MEQIKTKRPEQEAIGREVRIMMFMDEANDLLTPYLRHPAFKEFKNKTPRIQELTELMRGEIARTNIKHPLGIRCVELNEATEQAFREFAALCKQDLK